MNKMSNDVLKDAYSHTLYNVLDYQTAKQSGCISCRRIFTIDEPLDFVDNGKTALCPYCGCDSIIFDSSGIKLTKELLAKLNKKYF